MAETIRDIITQKSEALREIDKLGPHQAAEELVILTSLLSSLNKHISEKEYWLNHLKLEKLLEHGSAAKANIHAKASQEWRDFNDAKVQGEALEEMIRAIKHYLRIVGDEFKLQ